MYSAGKKVSFIFGMRPRKVDSPEVTSAMSAARKDRTSLSDVETPSSSTADQPQFYQFSENSEEAVPFYLMGQALPRQSRRLVQMRTTHRDTASQMMRQVAVNAGPVVRSVMNQFDEPHERTILAAGAAAVAEGWYLIPILAEGGVGGAFLVGIGLGLGAIAIAGVATAGAIYLYQNREEIFGVDQEVTKPVIYADPAVDQEKLSEVSHKLEEAMKRQRLAYEAEQSQLPLNTILSIQLFTEQTAASPEATTDIVGSGNVAPLLVLRPPVQLAAVPDDDQEIEAWHQQQLRRMVYRDQKIVLGDPEKESEVAVWHTVSAREAVAKQMNTPTVTEIEELKESLTAMERNQLFANSTPGKPRPFIRRVTSDGVVVLFEGKANGSLRDLKVHYLVEETSCGHPSAEEIATLKSQLTEIKSG